MMREVPWLFPHSVLDAGEPVPGHVHSQVPPPGSLEEGGAHEARSFPACSLVMFRYTRTPSAPPTGTGTPVQCEQTVKERVADRPCVTADIQGAVGDGGAGAGGMALHSSICHLNLSRFCHCINQHILGKFFRLSRKVEECDALGTGAAQLAGRGVPTASA